MEKVNILGINLAKLNRSEVLAEIKSYFQGSKPNLIVTPNAEFILRAQEDEEFHYILNNASLSILDGSGPQFACLATGNLVHRYPGADLIVDILSLAALHGQRVAILNWRGGLSAATDTTTTIKQKYPDLDFAVFDIERDGTDLNLDNINAFTPSIVIANLGAPFQEKILFHNLETIPSLRVAIGIGGALDFLTGKVERAPKLMRTIGVEWLWRMFQRPKQTDKQIIYQRYARVWNATAVFVMKFVRWQFISPFFYRQNVACLLYKKNDEGYFVAMVERKGMSDAWQLPQGGTDGESLIEAGKRELLEELNVTSVSNILTYKNVWRYDFPKAPKTEAIRHSGYKGQSQSLFIAEFTGDDAEIKINFWDHSAWQWVKASEVLSTTYEVRRAGYEKYLDLFNSVIKNEIRH